MGTMAHDGDHARSAQSSIASNHPPVSRSHPACSNRAAVNATSTSVDDSLSGEFLQRSWSLTAGVDHSEVVRPRTPAGIEPCPAGAPLVETERHEHVGDLGRRRHAVAEETVRADRRPALHGAGNREHLDPALGGLPRRDQAATAFAALDHHQHLDQTGQDPVAQGEAKRVGVRSRRPLGDQRPSFGDGVPQLGVLLRVRPVEPVADDAHRSGTLHRERATMSGTVDAPRETGHDDHAGRRQLVAELCCGFAAALCGVAGADDADAPGVEHAEVAPDEQHRRPARIVEQLRRVRRVAGHDDRDAPGHTRLPRQLGRPAVGLGSPRRRERRVAPEQRRDRLGWPLTPDGDRVGLGGVTPGEERRQPPRRHAFEPGEGGDVTGGRGHAALPTRRAAARLARNRRASATSSSVT